MTVKIATFKPGVNAFHYAALDNYDQDSHPDSLAHFRTSFKNACTTYFHFDADPVYDVICERMQRPGEKGRIVLAHAEGWRPHALAAAYAVWSLLCNPMGRAFIFSPHMATLSVAREIIYRMVMDNPVLVNALEFDGLSVRLKAAPERRIEWVHPDTLTDKKIKQMTGCYSFVYVDCAHQCANELLEALRDTLYVQQTALIAGVPMSAQGAFKALWDNPSFVRMKIDALALSDYHRTKAHKMREQSGEDSDLYRSTILAEFPRA